MQCKIAHIVNKVATLNSHIRSSALKILLAALEPTCLQLPEGEESDFRVSDQTNQATL